MTAKKTFERTYDVTIPGPLAPLDGPTKAGLTRRLRADAKKDGIEAPLGDTTVVHFEGMIGGDFKVLVRAVIGEEPTGPEDSDGE